MSSNPWDAYSTGRVRALWPLHSAAEIAKALNAELNTIVFTRNSVMGKVHRLRALNLLPGKAGCRQERRRA